MGRWMGRLGAALAVVMVTSVIVTAVPRQRDVRFIVGAYKEMPELETPTPAPLPAEPTPVPTQAQPRPNPVFAPRPIIGPPGNGPGPARSYAGTFVPPKDLLFFLVIGSDARPGQDMTRARADSIHIAAVDPKAREGTILGIPRDSYVDIPGHGQRKINAALPLGGPNLLVKTVRELTKMPISHYAVTGFEGMETMVDTLDGVDVYVPYRMNDRYSGAYFEEGWRHMDGREVLAFSRARHGVPDGDFGRSLNHGRVMVHTLKKMRAETKDKDDLRRWLNVLFKHTQLDMSMKDALGFAVLARNIIPSDLVNVVAPGKGEMVGDQSVVVLGEEAKALFKDVAADAVADGDLKRNPPAPTPKPKPTPTPTPEPGMLDDLLPFPRS